MQSSLNVTRSTSSPLLAQRKSNSLGGFTAIAILLPQALAFVAASGIEAKAELYTAVVAGTVLVALAIARFLQRPSVKKNFNA